MINLEKYMQEAISEAKISLREGNHGFGAVIVKDNIIISKAHDLEETNGDPTSHAEINAIRLAASIIGKNLDGCILLSTHEPCPMCSTAIIWAGIDHLAYGYSMSESIKQGCKRINLPCEELFTRAEKEIKVDKNVLIDQCSILYRQDVRSEIERLRNINNEKLNDYNTDSITRRLDWFNKKRSTFTFINQNLLDSAYNLLLCRLNIERSKAVSYTHLTLPTN